MLRVQHMAGHICVLAVIATTFLMPSAACLAQGGTTYFVRKSGSNSNNGTTADTAYKTISKAVSVVAAGDTVYVGAGTYSEEVKIKDTDGNSNARIQFVADTSGTYTSDSGDVFVKKSGKPAIQVEGSDWITISGFTFIKSKHGIEWKESDDGIMSKCEAYDNDEMGFRMHGSSVTVTNCYAHDNEKSGFRTCHGSIVSIGYCESEGNGDHGLEVVATETVLSVGQMYIHSNDAEGVDIRDTQSATFVNCLIVNNGDDGFDLSSSGNPVAYLWNSVIANNADDGVDQDGGTLQVVNCIVAHNDDNGFDIDGGSWTHSNNLSYGNSGENWEGSSAGDGSLSTDPLFAGGSGGTDFRLLADSPAIDAGSSASSFTSIDYAGTLRPQGGGWDMGAYEGSGVILLFTDVSSSVGFDVQATSSSDSYGSGWHWGDLDNDGDLDAIATGSTARLYISNNTGASFFTSSLGGYRRQAGLIDIDNDGDLDCWVANNNSYYANALLANNGSGSFSNVGDMGFDDPSNNEGLAIADPNRDGVADIVIFSENGNWIGFNDGAESLAVTGTDDSAYGLDDSAGNGDFCSSADVNNDGYLDYFYHYGNGQLFLSDGDGTFTLTSSGISVQTGTSDKFGSSWGDYDNDGDLDLFCARYDSSNYPYLWQNNSGVFTNVASAAGLDSLPGTRSGCWGDYDNDGDLDLYVVTRSGNANILYANQGDGSFVVASEGAEATGDGHDAVFVDYDNDGDLDLAVSNAGANTVLLNNGTDDTSYLMVRVVGAGAGGTNRAAIGTRVELYDAGGTTLLGRRMVGGARGFAGSSPLWVHFGGIDDATSYVVKVFFVSATTTTTVTPSATSTTIGSTTISQMVTVTESLSDGHRVLRWTEVSPDGQ